MAHQLLGRTVSMPYDVRLNRRQVDEYEVVDSTSSRNQSHVEAFLYSAEQLRQHQVAAKHFSAKVGTIFSCTMWYDGTVTAQPGSELYSVRFPTSDGQETQSDLSESQVRERLVTDIHAGVLPREMQPGTLCTICQHEVAPNCDNEVAASNIDAL